MICKNKNIIILMPPKTASNSLKVLLEGSGFIFSNEPNLPHPQIHLKLSELVDVYKIDNLNQYTIIQITRNPYERFVSSFFFQKKILPETYHPLFKDYDLPTFTNHLLESKNSSDFIESFYGDTSFVRNNIKQGINWGGSRLYDSQVSWNDMNQNVTYFKLEDISKDLNPLRELLGLNSLVLPTINSQGLNIDYQSLLTQDIKNILSHLFHDDFKLLGYAK